MKAMPRGSCCLIVSASAVTNPGDGACGGPQAPAKAGPCHWAQGALRQDEAQVTLLESLLTPQPIQWWRVSNQQLRPVIWWKEFVTFENKGSSVQMSFAFWSVSFPGSFWVVSDSVVWIIWIQRDFARSRSNQLCDTWRSCLEKLEENELWSPRGLDSTLLLYDFWLINLIS